jgi:hypothetical protein
MPEQYQKELKFVFGDYIEAYEGTDNTSRPHSVACIALFPVGNATGSWQLFKIANRTRVRQTSMVKLVTSGLVVDAMNAIAKEEAEAMGRNQGVLKVGIDQQSADDETEGNEETPNEDPAEIHPEVQQEIPAEIPPESREEVKEEHQEPAEEQVQDEGEGEPNITT